jgi:hypothetical protein
MTFIDDATASAAALADALRSMFAAEQLRQLGDTGRDLPRLILRHEIRRSAPARCGFKVDKSDREAVAIPYNEAGIIGFVEGPGRRESTIGHRGTLPWTAISAAVSGSEADPLPTAGRPGPNRATF